jgi:hypothetical protein
MGAWGTGIFSDDIALDVKAAFRELIAAGRSPEEATREIVGSYEMTEPDDAYDGPAWLGLAVTQWKMGRVVDHVRDTALRAIELELAHPIFEGCDVRKRAAVLAKTRDQLSSTPPAPRRVRAERFSQTPFAVGDVMRYTTSSGRQVALWAVFNDRHESFAHVSVNTLFRVQAIGDPTLPALNEIVSQPPLVTTSAEYGVRHVHELFLLEPQDAVAPVWEVIGNVAFPDPVDSLLGRGFTVIRVKSRGGRVPSPDAMFEQWFAQSHITHEDVIAVQPLVDLMPELPAHRRSWTGWATMKASDLAAELAVELDEGDDARCVQAFSILERYLAGDDAAQRRIAITVLDGLLNAATHPEVAFDRDDLALLMGSASQAVAARLDEAWTSVAPTASIPHALQPRHAEDPVAATFHKKWRWNARLDSRYLGDGTYRASGSAASQFLPPPASLID